MRAATRLMMMGNRNGHNEDLSGGRAQPRTSTAQGHTYDRNSMPRDGVKYNRDRNASYNEYDPDTEVNELGQRGKRIGGEVEEDEWDGGKGRDKKRLHATGMAWTDDEEQHRGKEPKEVTEESAMEWVHKMKAVDGAPMPKYKHEQTEQMRKAHCPECDEWEWFTAVNMMYADYSEAAKKVNANRDEFYALMAKAFLMDEDAGPDKLAKYMHEIPKK